MIDDNAKELVISRIFDAPVEKVWKAWTEPEYLKQWWGPKDFTAPEIKIDFKVGGKYLYCMRGVPAPGRPEQDLWSGGEFKEIVLHEKIVVTDYFADKDGNKLSPADFGLSPDFPQESIVTEVFEEIDGKTKLRLIYPLPEDPKARKAILESGMEEGWGQSLDKFEASLK